MTSPGLSVDRLVLTRGAQRVLDDISFGMHAGEIVTLIGANGAGKTTLLETIVLSVDLYAAGSRSVESSVLLRQQFDPLLGIVRPTLGGLYLAVSLLVPIASARAIAVEKERGTFRALILETGAPLRLFLAKFLASAAGVSLFLLTPMALLAVWWLAGGHLAFSETIVALSAYVFYALLVSAIATASASWTVTLAQASTLALVIVAASWAVDASEAFAALAWLGRAIDWSVTTHLGPMERGLFAPSAYLWILAVAGGALGFGYLGFRFDLEPRRRALLAGAAVVVSLITASFAHEVSIAFDVTEGARRSLPPGVIAELRAVHMPIALEIALDRDDARRRQMAADVLTKLRLARSDIRITFPNDDRPAVAEGERDTGYGLVTVRAGSATKQTSSSFTSFAERERS